MDLRVPINVESVGVVAVSSAVLEWKGTSNNSINIFQHNCLLLLLTETFGSSTQPSRFFRILHKVFSIV